MNQSLNFHITDNSLTSKSTESIFWPVCQVSSKGAVKVDIFGHLVWFHPVAYRKLMGHCGWIRKARLPDLLSFLRNELGDNLIPVERAGPGPSPQSHRFKVKVCIPGSHHYPELRRVRIFTLPVSTIVALQGRQYAPFWVFKEKLNQGEELEHSQWPGLPLVEARFTEAFARAALPLPPPPPTDAEIFEAQALAKATEAARLERQRTEEAERLAHEERKRRLAANAPIPDRVESNCEVSFIKWEKRGTGFRGRTQLTYQGCQVRYFGEKREITTADGKMIIKLKSPNLTIIPVTTFAHVPAPRNE